MICLDLFTKFAKNLIKVSRYMWELAKFMWKWIFIIFVCLIIIIADGFNYFMEMVLTSIGVMGIILVSLYLCITYRRNKRCKVLGCRKYGDKSRSEEQFRSECKKYSIYPNYQIMICDYLREIEAKGLHIELVKEEGIVYNPREGSYLGSKDWQDKWSRIIFSPQITGWKFCRSIGVIIRAHGISGLFDIDIKRSDSYFTFEVLHLMRYNIILKENDDSFKNCEVVTPRTLHKRLRNR